MNLLKSTTSQIPNSISLASSEVHKQEIFITFLLKLAQSSVFLQDIASATKNLKICNIGLSSIQELIRCLLHHGMTIEAAAIIASRVDCFGPKMNDSHYIHSTLILPCQSRSYSSSQLDHLIMECTWPRSLIPNSSHKSSTLVYLNSLLLSLLTFLWLFQTHCEFF
jgi:hypothetical protein